MKITVRDVPPRAAWNLEQAGIHPLLARLYAARGVLSTSDLDDGLDKLLPPHTLLGAADAAKLLADAIENDKHICVVADYDCDGATACATAIRGLKLLGAKNVSYLVPDRVVDGYGLTPQIADRVKGKGADMLMTVDNGIASIEGVDRALELGLKVIVSDHHLSAVINGQVVLPAADVIVNPNQPQCTFESKSLAGVGVVFYILMALRGEMRQRLKFDAKSQPRLDTLLPLVALGTVADVVKLDANNRRLVAQGLKRIRQLALPCGMASLFAAASRKAERATTFDLGFALGPRINAAGRLSDMTLGIECLVTDDATRADELARTLDAINRERREIESDMREQALQIAYQMLDESETPPASICVFDPDFHEGVVGIVASRIKDKMHRPCFVFASSQAEGKEHEMKGSGRSIAGFHMRDALDLISKRHPDLLLRFGGHAMAAGCTIHEDNLDEFEQAFHRVASESLDQATLTRQLQTDGSLQAEYRRVELVDNLHKEVWGQGFAPPTFSDEVQIISQRLVGEKHLQLRMNLQGENVDGIWFGRTEPLPAKAKIAYRLDADEWNGVRRVRFLVEGAEE